MSPGQKWHLAPSSKVLATEPDLPPAVQVQIHAVWPHAAPLSLFAILSLPHQADTLSLAGPVGLGLPLSPA